MLFWIICLLWKITLFSKTKYDDKSTIILHFSNPLNQRQQLGFHAYFLIHLSVYDILFIYNLSLQQKLIIIIFYMLLRTEGWSGQISYLFKFPLLVNSKSDLTWLFLVRKPQDWPPWVKRPWLKSTNIPWNL